MKTMRTVQGMQQRYGCVILWRLVTNVVISPRFSIAQKHETTGRYSSTYERVAHTVGLLHRQPPHLLSPMSTCHRTAEVVRTSVNINGVGELEEVHTQPRTMTQPTTISH